MELGKVCKKMHKHVFDGENINLSQVMNDLYENFTLIFKATNSQCQNLRNMRFRFELLETSDFREARKQLEFLLTFSRCMLKRCVEDGTGVINTDLVDLLMDVESFFVDFFGFCSRAVSRGRMIDLEEMDFVHMGRPECKRCSNAYVAVFGTDSSTSSSFFIQRDEVMVEFLDLILENLDDCRTDEKIETCVEKLQFLRNYIQFTKEYWMSGEGFKEFLIYVEVVAESAACYSFLKILGESYTPEQYMQIENSLKSKLGVGVLKALVLRLKDSTDHLPALTNGLLKTYVDCVLEILKKMINDDEAIDVMPPQVKNQFEDLHKELEKVVGLMLNYPPKDETEIEKLVGFILNNPPKNKAEQEKLVGLILNYPPKNELEKLSDIRRHFQTLVGNVGSLVLLSLNEETMATETSTLGISDLLQEARILEDHITDIVLLAGRNKYREMKGRSVELPKVCKKMHKHVFQGKNINLRQVMNDVYENFTLIFKATISEYEKLESKIYIYYDHEFLELRKGLGFLITFSTCMLRQCVKEGGVIHGSLIDILTDVESHFVDLLERCSRVLSRGSFSLSGETEFLSMGSFEHMVSRVSNAFLAVFSTASSPSTMGLIQTDELMVAYLDQLLENLNQCDVEDKSIKTSIEILEFLRNYLKFTKEYWMSGKGLKELLISVEDVAESAACYSFLKKYGKLSLLEHLPIKNRVESEIGNAVLKAFVLLKSKDPTEHLPRMTDELLKIFACFVKEFLTMLIKDYEATDLMTLTPQVKNHFEDLHQELEKLVGLILNYPLEKLADYKRRFQTLVGNVGSLVLSCLSEENMAKETTTLEVSDLLQKAHLVKDQIMDIVLLATSGSVGRYSPKTDQLGFFNFLIKNLRRVNDFSFDGFKIVHEDLAFFRSFIQNMMGKNSTGRAAYEAGYFINSTDHLSPLPDGLLKGYVCCVQENITDIINDDLMTQVKNQFEDLLEDFEFLAGSIHSHPVELEKLSDTRTQYQTLVGVVGSMLLFPNKEMGLSVAAQTSTLEIWRDFLEKAYLLRERINHMCWLITFGRIARNAPQTYQLGFLTFLIDNLSEFKDFSFNFKTYEAGGFEAIHENLVLLRSFLQNTMGNNSTPDDDESKDLLNRIGCAAYEAEYFINSYVADFIPECCISCWFSEFKQQVKLIKSKFAVISEKRLASDVNNIDIIARSRNPSRLLPTSDVVVGFQAEMDIMKERLIGGGVKLDVISIIGMAGLGKTTFAMKLYEDPSIVDHFELRAWCCVSQIYNKKELLLAILGSISKLSPDAYNKSDGDLSAMLYRQLTEKRYLIFMDDIWGMDPYKDLKRFFPDNRSGSRIILTSRNRLEDYKDPLELRFLTREESWNLLRLKVYQNNEEIPPQFRQVGEEIAEKCSGLPLAIVVVAGILAKSEKKRNFWEQVAGNLSLYIAGDTTQAQVMAVLELSYELLPDRLKPLFLYLGAFPEDTEIPADKLAWLWIAERFEHKTDQLTLSLEVQAELDLVDLIDRSLVMISKKRSDGRVKSCRVHDLLRDMCLRKAKEENFMRLININAASRNYVTYERRLSISLMGGTYLYLRHESTLFPMCRGLLKRSIAPPLNSLLFFNMNKTIPLSDEDIRSVFHDFRLLRILHSESITIDENTYKDQVEKLVHLRYISIRADWKSIPSSISKLWNLETLIIKGLEGEIVVPEEIWELVKLRHLHINYRANFSGALLHESSSKLENLQTLSTPVVCCGEENKLTQRVSNLRKLRFISVEAKNSSGKFEYRLPQLGSLDLLESLKILCNCRMRYISGEFGLPSTLKKLTLSKFRLQWSDISSFQKLPNLEVLKLRGGTFGDTLWDMEDVEFSKLKFLKLESLNIKEWIVSPDSFPCLKKLVLQSCKQLQEIPSSVGDFYSLEKIEVVWCSTSAVSSAKQIQEEQKDAGNELLKVQIHMSS